MRATAAEPGARSSASPAREEESWAEEHQHAYFSDSRLHDAYYDGYHCKRKGPSGIITISCSSVLWSHVASWKRPGPERDPGLCTGWLSGQGRLS